MSFLKGIRVLDVASYVAGPAAATVMADFGADVVKVEPKEGDPYRQLGANAGPHNPFWVQDARSKRGLCIDLKDPRGRELLLQMVGKADVFVTNYRTELLERLGLHWSRLRVLNSRLIYAAVTGYGEAGDEANAPAFDVTAWWARSGLMDWVRRPGAPPAVSSPGMGDHATAMALFGGIMAALFQRERTGAGTKVSTSLLANGVWSHSMLAALALCGMPTADRDQPAEITNALAIPYETSDGRWVMMAVLNEPKEWELLLQALEVEPLSADERFNSVANRRINAPALAATLAVAFKRFCKGEIEQRFAAVQITHGFATTLKELPSDMQLYAAKILTPLAQPREGLSHLVDSPVWIEGAHKQAPSYAPQIGQHSREVLRDYGVNEQLVDQLVDAGVVQCHAVDA